MAYEALNNASNLKTNFIVVLNDNHMSISENVGGMSRYLANLRTADIYTGLKKGVTNALQQVPVMGDRMIEHIRKTKSSIKQLVVPGMFFEDMGITYLGPIPGHNLPMLCKALKESLKSSLMKSCIFDQNNAHKRQCYGNIHVLCRWCKPKHTCYIGYSNENYG